MQTTNFYLLKDDDIRTYTRSICQLADQLWSQSLTVHLYCDSEEKARQWDDDLWTFQDIRFIPHGLLIDHNPLTDSLPICLIHFPNKVNFSAPYDVLFNLAEEVPDFFSNYKKIIEVVSVNETARIKSRKRYKTYQKAGYQIQTEDYQQP